MAYAKVKSSQITYDDKTWWKVVTFSDEEAVAWAARTIRAEDAEAAGARAAAEAAAAAHANPAAPLNDISESQVTLVNCDDKTITKEYVTIADACADFGCKASDLVLAMVKATDVTNGDDTWWKVIEFSDT